MTNVKGDLPSCIAIVLVRTAPVHQLGLNRRPPLLFRHQICAAIVTASMVQSEIMFSGTLAAGRSAWILACGVITGVLSLIW